MMARSKALPQWSTPSQGKRWPRRAGGAVVGAAAEQSYLAVVVASPADCGEADFGERQAELRLAQSSRSLPLARPLRQWLDDYCDLLETTLHGPASTGEKTTSAVREEIREFLGLMLTGRDRSAAEFIRTLTELHPFTDELRRFRRVQALFATIRPARSLAEALDFRIVATPAVS